MTQLAEQIKQAISALAYADIGERATRREKYAILSRKPASPSIAPPPPSRKRVHAKSYSRPLATTALFGIGSIVLYVLLILNSDLFIEWAQRTKDGEKGLFLVPILAAFLFSFVHGAFTGHFWESIGLRAAGDGGGMKR